MQLKDYNKFALISQAVDDEAARKIAKELYKSLGYDIDQITLLWFNLGYIRERVSLPIFHIAWKRDVGLKNLWYYLGKMALADLDKGPKKNEEWKSY